MTHKAFEKSDDEKGRRYITFMTLKGQYISDFLRLARLIVVTFLTKFEC